MLTNIFIKMLVKTFFKYWICVFSKQMLVRLFQEMFVANMASYAISSSLTLVIHDNMIIGTNHTV
jgi:hypothetical protein